MRKREQYSSIAIIRGQAKAILATVRRLFWQSAARFTAT
jgi:hypothetical protein